MTRLIAIVAAVLASVASNHATDEDEDDEPEPDYAECCECLARNSAPDVVGDGVPPDERPRCIPDAQECEAALENDDSITVFDSCVDESCEYSCAFLANSADA